MKAALLIFILSLFLAFFRFSATITGRMTMDIIKWRGRGVSTTMTMARSLAERIPAALLPIRGRTTERIRPRSYVPWPPLLLALLAIGALVAAYVVRPTVQVDLGDYYDSAFVNGFHGREIDATSTGATTPWPIDSTEIVLPGHREGILVATLHVADAKGDGALEDVALAANGLRVSIPRRLPRELVAFIPAEVAAADQIVLRLVPPVEGDAPIAPGLVSGVTLSPARTYRWSQGESHVTMPGLGRGDWRVDLTVVTANPANRPLDARISANGTPLVTLPEGISDRRISVLVPSEAMGSGDLDLMLTTNTFTTTADARQLGVFVSEVSAQPAGSTPWLPPFANLLYTLVIAFGVYVCLLRLTLSPWISAGAALALVLLGAWALVAYRFPTSFMLPRLAILAVWSVFLLLALERVVVWLFPEDESQTRKDEGQKAFVLRPSPFGRLLLLIFFVSYWIKAGGMLYPYFIGIDVAWHMDRVRWILDGQLPLLYSTNSPLNESTMPQAEWGNQKPVIPYSPYFHIFATSYTLLPFSLSLTANMVSALLDSTRLILIALLAVRGGLGRRAALLAALLYAVLPSMYLLHSWGNVPTTTGLWWTLATTTFMVAYWNRLGERWATVTLSLLFLMSMLIYTVAAVFMGIFLVFFTVGVWLWGRELRPGLRPVWIAALVAFAVALVIYYGQYIPPIIERTLPYFERSFTSSNESIGKASDTWGAYFMRHGRLWAYGLVVPMLLSVVYLLFERRLSAVDSQISEPSQASGIRHQSSGINRNLLTIVIASWLALMVLFVPLAYKVSMVDKHFFIAVPFMMLASGAVLDWATRRSWLLRGATVVFYAYLAVAAINLWLTRIAIVRQ